MPFCSTPDVLVCLTFTVCWTHKLVLKFRAKDNILSVHSFVCLVFKKFKTAKHEQGMYQELQIMNFRTGELETFKVKWGGIYFHSVLWTCGTDTEARAYDLICKPIWYHVHTGAKFWGWEHIRWVVAERSEGEGPKRESNAYKFTETPTSRCELMLQIFIYNIVLQMNLELFTWSTSRVTWTH